MLIKQCSRESQPWNKFSSCF